jgi:hypothetical protein
MDDALVVRRLERLGDLLRDGQSLIERQRPAREPLRQILAVDQFHHERANAGGLFESVNVRDIGMVESRQRLRLPLEAGQPVGILGERLRQDLDRHVAIEARVLRAIDFAHAARADGGGDLIGTKTLARAQEHGFEGIMFETGDVHTLPCRRHQHSPDVPDEIPGNSGTRPHVTLSWQS